MAPQNGTVDIRFVFNLIRMRARSLLPPPLCALTGTLVQETSDLQLSAGRNTRQFNVHSQAFVDQASKFEVRYTR